jgi:hypothetical protein
MAGARQLGVTAWRWAALPTVTATAKPAISPIAGKLREGTWADFCQKCRHRRRLNTDRFRRLFLRQGSSPWVAEAGIRDGMPQVDGTFDRLGDLKSKWRRGRRPVGASVGTVKGCRMRIEAGTHCDRPWMAACAGGMRNQLPKYLVVSRWSLRQSKTARASKCPWRWSWNPGAFLLRTEVLLRKGGIRGGASAGVYSADVHFGKRAREVFVTVAKSVGGPALPGDGGAPPKGCWPTCGRSPTPPIQALPIPSHWVPTVRPRFWSLLPRRDHGQPGHCRCVRPRSLQGSDHRWR